VLSSLLDTVNSDFHLVLEVCSGERKSTNKLKTLAECLHSDSIPSHWKRYIMPETTTAVEWLNDFKRRVEQLLKLSESNDHGRSGVWFGGLIAPEAYMIATQ
jgi:dynein heavy chain 1